MNFELIGTLIRLRYKLLWASTRTRNGKIALFFAGYLLLIMCAALLAAGGTGAGMAAVRSGKGTVLAGGVLTGVFVQALLASVMLGFGMGIIFSEGELLRFPLKARERWVTRHLTGIVDPFWILFFMLDLGIAFGLFLFGAGSFWFGLIAVLLLFACNYIAARALALLVERLTSKKFGSMIMLGGVMCLGFAPAMLTPVLKKNPALVEVLVRGWKASPPAAAGVAMTHFDLAGLQALGGILLWMAALVALLVVLERWPKKTAATGTSKIVWEDRADRLASVFGPKTGPLVAHWLRFYWRNTRFRTIYPLTLPLMVIALTYFSRQVKGVHAFTVGVAVFSIVVFVGTGQFAVNQFGYVGGGFRRFLLLPTDPAAAFRAGSYTFVSLSGILILPTLLIWLLLAPLPSTVTMVAMLLGCSFTMLFLVHGLALWTSLYGARRGKFNHTFGNDLSFAGNVVIIGSMMSLVFGMQIAERKWPGAISPAYWYVTPLLAVAALLFYVVSLRLTTAAFRTQREYLMVLMEGKG